MQYQYTQLPTSELNAGMLELNALPQKGVPNGQLLSPGIKSREIAAATQARTSDRTPSAADENKLLESRGKAHAQAMVNAKKFDMSQLRATWTVHPNNPVFGIWNPVMIMTIFMDAAIQPFICTFKRFMDSKTLVRRVSDMSNFAWIMYAIDTVFQLFIQIPKEDGSGMISSSGHVIQSYLRSADFIFDLITLIPWHFVSQITATSDVGSRGLHELIADIMPIARLTRLRNLGRLTYRYRNMLHISFTTHTVTECGFGFALCLHMLACTWALVGLENPLNESSTWIQTYWRPEVLGDNQDFKPSSLNIYLAAFYWALATTTSIGYGDVVPNCTSTAEQIASILLMCIAAISWSIIIANAVELVKDMHQRSEVLQRTMDSCEELFLEHDKLPATLTESIREYFKKSVDLDQQNSTQTLIARMSPMLQRSVVQCIYAEWIEDVPWIQNMSGPCLVRVVLRMENFLYIPGEIIPDARMTSFVHLGSLFIGGRILTKGDSWGVDMTLEGQMRRRESGFAMNFVSTLGLTNRHLVDVLEDFPEDAWTVKRVSCWMAVQRKIRQIAAQTRRCRRQSVFNRIMSANEVGQDKEFGQLGDDARYVVKVINDRFSSMQEGITDELKVILVENDSIQENAKRQQALEASVRSNTESLRSMETRLSGLEGSIGQILRLLQEPTSPVKGQSRSTGMFGR